MSGGNFVTLGPVPDSLGDGVQASAFGISGNTPNTPATIVPASAGKRVFVHGLLFGGNNTAQLLFVDANTSGATVALLTGSSSFGMSYNSGTQLILPFSQYPWFTCAAGDAFCVTTANVTISVGGRVMYVQG